MKDKFKWNEMFICIEYLKELCTVSMINNCISFYFVSANTLNIAKWL